MSTDYDFSTNTPLDNTMTSYSVFKSGYKNIRFALSATSTYTIDESDMANLVGVAFRLYGDVSLWRALLSFNGIQDQLQEVYPGLLLKVPNKSDVIAYLSAQKASQSPTIII